MKFIKPAHLGWIAGSLALVLALISAATTARANVYATDIKVNGSSSSITNGAGDPLSISFILNEAATLGTTINILSGTNAVATTNIASGSAGTLRGSNTVIWNGQGNGGSNVPAGTYSVSITAAAAGFPMWTQTSDDTNAGNYIYFPNGMAVDNNTNSPYYGRVVVGCSLSGGVNPISGAPNMDGIYKMNADGSYADEGGFGNGGYAMDDAGDVSSNPGQMPVSAYDNVPWTLRIGDDDRIYMLDYSALGAIIAFDMQVTTNQIVIDDGYKGALGGPNNYTNNPDFDDLVYGINNFDVTSTTTTHAAVWLCDIDSPDNWGIWMYHLKNGAADPADTEGTQPVIQSATSDLSEGSSGGCMIDNNLDIFVSQNTYYNDPLLRTMEYTNWNRGVLPPEKGGTNYAYGTATNQVHWGVGTNDATFESVQDTVINNRQHPTMVALPMLSGNDGYPGIRVLNATDGSVVTVTNGGGATIQALTNLDYPNQYSCAAWDNVGNLYGASLSLKLWRVFSPPGSNQATTAALGTVTLVAPPQIVQVSNLSVAVDSLILFTNQASGANGPFTFSLSEDSPGEISSNGVFQWTPSCPDGSTTNAITVWVTDSGNPPQSNSMTFLVIVSECVEVSIGSSVVQTGDSTCVPVNLFTTVNLTNLSFTLADPWGYFTNWTFTASNAAMASATPGGSYQTVFNVGVTNGQVLPSSSVIGTICMATFSGSPSAFVPLAPTNMAADASNNSPVTHFIGQHGTVVVIGSQSLVGGYVDTNFNRVLTVYGNPGTTYEILTTTNILDASSWSAAGAVTLSNLVLNTNVGGTNPQQYYRAVHYSP
jgi:hypothetical protein